MKLYRGTARAARDYVEAGRCRADDYYLAEGTGVAERLVVDGEGRVVELAGLSGDAYEAWVAGHDPTTGQARGRLRHDAHAVRFVEVIVNGPKSWSLAAELHPDVAAAYEAAQDRAARQILSWLGEHATVRVGSRGQQVAVPVERLDAAVVRHYTSRAGDPHRHLHVQVNARVYAAGTWRGLDTVAFRDSLQAINGIGHATMACDPEFRSALAAHGYTLTGEGEIAQLTGFVGAFSKRTQQIANLLDRYEAAWRTQHPRDEPGPHLRRSWDARAWAQNRPDKVVPRDGAELRQRWIDELRQLGYRDRDKPVQLALQLAGTIDRDAVAAEVLARLGANHSAWNAADVRGEVEQLLARTGLITEPAVRGELADDLTTRAVALCSRLVAHPTPEHVRAFTSPHVLATAAELHERLVERGEVPMMRSEPIASDGLDEGQRAAVTVLASDARLVVIEGAAGAGKTTTLAATRAALEREGQRLLVVTPTLKAAQVASGEIRTRAGSAAWLAWQHGWRWNGIGEWTREPAAPTPDAVLHAGDLLLCDEAGMLDQDTARALLTIADESGARIALLGDRRQLPAVGRGGVLDLAQDAAHPDARLDLNTVHRFLHTVDGVTVPDTDYADLTLAMRDGEGAAAVFDALVARGQVVVYGSEIDGADALAAAVAAERVDGGAPAVVVDTREHAELLNTAIRDRLVTAGVVDDRRVVVTGGGQRVGVGDVIVTRRNDPVLDVANRQVWTVTRVHRDGYLTIRDTSIRDAGCVERQLPVEYVHRFVELGYASTGYGAQGDTSDTAHLVLTDKTSAAGAYVAMTRGRHANTAHLVAASLDEAREQWVAAFGRDRADLGPAHAAEAAARAAAAYQPASDPASPERVAAVLDELRQAWTEQHTAQHGLQYAEQRLAETEADADWWDRVGAVLAPLAQARNAAYDARERAAGEVARYVSGQMLDVATERAVTGLRLAWDRELAHADQDARVVAEGPGRLGLHRTRMREAEQRLDAWQHRWAPALADSDIDLHQIQAHPLRYPAAVERVGQALYQHAQHLAAAERPDDAARIQALQHANADYEQAAHADAEARRQLGEQSHRPCYDTGAAQELPERRQRVADARSQAQRADERVHRLEHDPAITSQPDPRRVLDAARQDWHDQRAADAAARELRYATQRQAAFHPRHVEPYAPAPPTSYGPSIGR